MVSYAFGRPAGAEGLNMVFTMHTHRFIDDWESLSATLREAGLSHVDHSSFNASEIPELRIDNEAPSRPARKPLRGSSAMTDSGVPPRQSP